MGRTIDTELRQRVIDTYQNLLKNGIPTKSQLGRAVYGENDYLATSKINQLLHRIGNTYCFEFKGGRERNNEEEAVELDEVNVLKRMIYLLGSLKDSKSMKKIVDIIANGMFTLDEATVIFEMVKLTKKIPDDARERIFFYISDKFKF